MKKLIASVCLMMLSSVAQAESITCVLNPYVAGQSGLKRVADIKLSVELKEQNDVGSKGCAFSDSIGSKIAVCVQNSMYRGHYDISVDQMPEGRGYQETLAFALLATNSKNRSIEVTAASRSTQVLSSIQRKLSARNIEIPSIVSEETSEQIHASVARGVREGVLKPGEFVLIEIARCSR